MEGRLLDVEASFCYIGDMLCAGGGCALAIATRCSTAKVKFKKLLPILTSEHVPVLCVALVLAQPCYMGVKRGQHQPRFIEAM